MKGAARSPGGARVAFGAASLVASATIAIGTVFSNLLFA